MKKPLIALATGVLLGSGGTYLTTTNFALTQPTEKKAFDSQIDETLSGLDIALPALMSDNTTAEVKLRDYQGQWTLLFYYPEDGTTVCPTELRALLADKQKFDDLNVEILPISTDSIASHQEWKPNLTDENFDFTWLSDTEGALAKSLGIYDTETGDAFRGTFLINPEGVLRSSIIYNNDIARSNDEIVRMIEQNQIVEETGGVCPSGWESGDETIEAIPEYEIQSETKTED